MRINAGRVSMKILATSAVLVTFAAASRRPANRTCPCARSHSAPILTGNRINPGAAKTTREG